MSPNLLLTLLALAIGFPRIRAVGGLPSTPGCDKRPTCPKKDDERCKDALYFQDLCFPNVYWECAFQKPVPVVCPDGLVVNPLAILNPKDKAVALCDRPPGIGGKMDNSETTLRPTCGCHGNCRVPPTCPTKLADDCKGSVFLPFRCDCQFYWVCDASHVPHLQACGAGYYFRPRASYGGNCVPAGNWPEATACLVKVKKHRPLSHKKF